MFSNVSPQLLNHCLNDFPYSHPKMFETDQGQQQERSEQKVNHVSSEEEHEERHGSSHNNGPTGLHYRDVLSDPNT